MEDLSILSVILKVENLVGNRLIEENRKEREHPNADFMRRLFDIL